MTGYAGHLSDRCGAMNRVLDGTSSDWGTMMDDCQAGPAGMHGGGMMGGGCNALTCVRGSAVQCLKGTGTCRLVRDVEGGDA